MRTEAILGYPVTAEDLPWCVDRLVAELPRRRAAYFVCANPHSLVVADDDPGFREAILAADLVTPDGAGILLASRLLGGTIRRRVTGTDMFMALNRCLDARRGYRCFFLGSTEATLARIVTRMARDFPDLCVAGTYSPPYKPAFDEADNAAMIEAINRARPDVLWVGMTAPKQEKWIHANRHRLDVGCIGPVGAVFDFYVGNVKRSHPAFQRLGLEWLPRLVQEPRRLWRRNFISSPVFLGRALRQRLRHGR